MSILTTLLWILEHVWRDSEGEISICCIADSYRLLKLIGVSEIVKDLRYSPLQ